MLLCHAPHLTLTHVTLAVTCRAGDAACHPPPSPSLPPLHLPLCLGLFLPRPNSSTPISPCRTQPEKFLCKTSLETLLSFPIAKSWARPALVEHHLQISTGSHSSHSLVLWPCCLLSTAWGSSSLELFLVIWGLLPRAAERGPSTHICFSERFCLPGVLEARLSIQTLF